MLKEPIAITALSSISALGNSSEEVWESYQNGKHHISKTRIGNQTVWASVLPESIQSNIEDLRHSDAKYKDLDASVLFAMYTARKAIAAAGWKSETNFGVNIGSSRGATALFEKFHQEFLEEGKSSTLSSPTTTLGNISSWVGHDLKSKGPDISHSITCSTALHAVLNAVAWIQSGLSDKFLVGGSEAPLTPFTIAQMQALKIYSKEDGDYPCRAMDFGKKQNSMILGDGSALACLESGQKNNALGYISGIGFATEPLEHNVSISSDAVCFQDSMKMALGHLDPSKIDAIILHSPGTVKGDVSELKAIEKIFCNKIPFLTTNKWKVGHTFGASGLLSVELALLMLQHQTYISTPFFNQEPNSKAIKNIMVNAVGFGGNAVSILLSK
ncbi:beta-ketoacyl synthase N-terminal-like domain-containing protein [Flagellimonas myxillae]|uniref:beta-ketoacyl synthase N-terminal-like domain-containing protein n=1 Tax=Flagellimonas myxillae TaxID=2942214 RepID=UPI00201ED66E|nr:beta-ketoacyl synthase N-terminal-like domain-containing protein [Muricauda myxillae]MCL6267490.1 beta-ketoacyl synthase [Muricauda myxillae]